jgi:hypothetical protein
MLRYELTTEFEHLGRPASLERPLDAVGTINRWVNEWMVNLADLDPARVLVINPARIKGSTSVSFATADGKEAISRTGQEYTRLGVWMRTQQSRIGYFPLRDDGRLNEVAEALRRAITVCRNPSR